MWTENVTTFCVCLPLLLYMFILRCDVFNIITICYIYRVSLLKAARGAHFTPQQSNAMKGWHDLLRLFALLGTHIMRQITACSIWIIATDGRSVGWLFVRPTSSSSIDYGSGWKYLCGVSVCLWVVVVAGIVCITKPLNLESNS